VYFDIDYVRNAKSVNYWRNRYDLCTVYVVTGRCDNLVIVVICLMSRVVTESTIFFVLYYFVVSGTETVQVTLLRRTLASSPESECARCLQCLDTVGWAADRASGL